MESPTLRQLGYFVALAEELHFGRAAERTGIAQPPLTQQIQKLERLAGCQLLIRGRKTRLTQAGAALADDASRLLAQAGTVLDRARRIAKGDDGQLRVGVPPSVMLTDLPRVVRRYRAQYPRVDFTLRELATSAIEDALRARQIDIGFLRQSQPERPLQSELFLSERVVAVLPARHRLASSAKLSLAKLKDEPFVLFPRRLGPAFYDHLTGACLEAGFTPRIAQEATQWQTVVSFVEAGMGVSLAPECVSRFRRAGVAYRAIPQLRTEVYVSWREDDVPATAERFLALASKRRVG